jgi:tocopherol cyclase
MTSRIKNIWRPWNFHYHRFLGRPNDCFEGWYFKIVDASGEHPYAFIPGVFMGVADRHSFIQVLDGARGRSWYHRYSVQQFQPHATEFDVAVGGSRFHRSGMELNIHNDSQSIRGEIRIGPWSTWPVTALSPGVMGPFSFMPFMECFHGILSMDHEISGEIEVEGSRISFNKGRGYMEKDWGRGFPEGYVWTQSNRFDRTGVSVSASVAKIPFMGTAFRGFLVGMLLDGTLHRFTTYNGGFIESLNLTATHLKIKIRNRTHRLQISSEKTSGALLMAPYDKQMLERVAETMTSTVQVRLSLLKGEKLIYEGTGRNGCLEVQGNVSFIADNA